MKKNIGIEVKNKPKQKCEDPRCPFHGTVSLHGRIFTGTIVADKMHKTVSVAWDRKIFVPKFERYAKRSSKIKAHNPDCIKAKLNDKVRVMETRPLSKTKNFVVIEVLDNTGENKK